MVADLDPALFQKTPDSPLKRRLGQTEFPLYHLRRYLIIKGQKMCIRDREA